MCIEAISESGLFGSLIPLLSRGGDCELSLDKGKGC
jgi:hypothetical protein